MVYPYFIKIIIFSGLTRNIFCDEVSDVKEIIDEGITNYENYVLPTDNSEILNTTSDKINEFGVYDFIIVGAGASGCVLTYELSLVKNWKILLLEAGGDELEFSQIPAMHIFLRNTELNWGYSTVPEDTGYGTQRQQSYYQGKAMGGSTSINGMVYTRGNKADYDQWEQMGNSGWSYRDVLPIFIRHENSRNVKGDSGYHGYKGPLRTNFTYGETTYLPVYYDGNAELELDAVDVNGRNQTGYTKTVVNIIGNERLSASRAFIRSIRNRNIKIVKNAFVTNLIYKNKNSKTVNGVEFVRNKQKYRATVRKEVILSAGVFNTPQILMLSGIGPKEELDKLNISVVADLPVGKNLQDPNFISIAFTSNTSEPVRSQDELIQRYVDYLAPLTNVGIEGISFIKTQSNLSLPDIELLTTDQYLDIRPFMTSNLTEISEKNLLPRIYALPLHPKSRGQVTLKSSDPKDFPNIELRSFSDEAGEDLETFYAGVQLALKLLETPAYKEINATIVYPSSDCDQEYTQGSKDYWYCRAKTSAGTAFHAVGTAKMGQSDTDSVVNHELKVHGIKGLRVVDASIMPEITSGHTAAPCMMIGGKGADLIKKDYISRKSVYIFFRGRFLLRRH